MKKVKRKRCKVCNELFLSYNTLQKVCSPKCAIEFNKRKVKADKYTINNLIKEKKERESLSRAIRFTTLKVHKYVRLRDKGKPCISCDCEWHDDFQAGHFYSAGKYTSIKFDLDNINGQCPQCNIFNEGEHDRYALSLPNRIGDDRHQNLIKRAQMSLKHVKKWTRIELKEIQKGINLKLKELQL